MMHFQADIAPFTTLRNINLGAVKYRYVNPDIFQRKKIEVELRFITVFIIDVYIYIWKTATFILIAVLYSLKTGPTIECLWDLSL